jgi:serine/threonine protein kinase
MQYVHSKGVIHRNLTPDNILLDWDWRVRIANFGISTFTNTVIQPNEITHGDAHYCAPECYKNIDDPVNDVFSFGLILYELVVGQPVFPGSMTPEKVVGAVVLRDSRPSIPDSVLPDTAELIQDCWAAKHSERLCFNGILDRLEKMQFKLIPRVNSSKLTAFVKGIKEWQTNNHQ